MRFPLLIAVLITAISAQAPAAASNCTQAVDAIPECGKTCIESAADAPPINCPHLDFSCYCAATTKIENTAILCVSKHCKPEEIPKVQDGAKSLCACLGIIKTDATSG